MDLRTEILREHSRKQAEKIATFIGNDQDKFDELICFLMGSEKVVAQRAAYAFRFSAEYYPALVDKHMEKLVLHLKKNVHNAVKRNILHILTLRDIPEELMGPAFDICLDFLINQKQAIAIKAFSMQVMFEITLKEPALAHELAMVIEDGMPTGSAGYKARGKRILKELKKRGWLN